MAIFLFHPKQLANPRKIRILEKGGTGGTKIPYRAIKNSGVGYKGINNKHLYSAKYYPTP